MHDKQETAARFFTKYEAPNDSEWLQYTRLNPARTVSVRQGVGVKRVEFFDGSAVIECGGGWRHGVHRDWLQEPEVVDALRHRPTTTQFARPEHFNGVKDAARFTYPRVDN